MKMIGSQIDRPVLDRLEVEAGIRVAGGVDAHDPEAVGAVLADELASRPASTSQPSGAAVPGVGHEAAQLLDRRAAA